MRVREIAWTRHHLRDLESDFSVFHGVDDIYTMPAPRFFSLAYRIAVYDGMLALRVRVEQEKAEAANTPPPAARPAAAPTSTTPAASRSVNGTNWQPLAQLAANNPALFERVRVSPADAKTE